MTTYKYELTFDSDKLSKFKVSDSTGNLIGENATRSFLDKLVRVDQTAITSVVNAMTNPNTAPKIDTLTGGKKKQTKKSKQRSNKTKRQRKRSFSISKSI